ncbi:MAG TPA: hypothetical protein VK954_02425 [Methyloradius sp.]|nr:hypothetical protein [Methyloradius sp.]
MKTIVYQSYRTTNVPGWIETCMQTVRAWAALKGFEYQFIDDSLFDYIPNWVREKSVGEICPQTDLARLIIAKKYLSQGYEQTIWIDADMVVFAPEHLVVSPQTGYLFCHETWVKSDQQGKLAITHHINNSITSFAKNNQQLDFLIDACLRIASLKPKLTRLDLGTTLLSSLGNAIPIPLLTNVGMFSPDMMTDITNGTDLYLKAYAAKMMAPLACANMCASLVGRSSRDVASDNLLYEQVIDKCLESKGEVVNRHFMPR